MTMDLDVEDLLLHSLAGGSSDSDETMKISDTCLALFRRDYECEVLENVNGTLCGTYPSKMFIPLPTKGGCKIKQLEEYVSKAKFARTRGRFVAPVLIVNDKYICRSSTLARSPEIYYRQGYGYFTQGDVAKPDDVTSESEEKESPCYELQQVKSVTVDEEGNEWMVDKMRNADIDLLRYLKVNVIFDFMVENKKVKYWVNVTSSEKVDKSQRYASFQLLSVPYPGCEFFVEYKKRDYKGEGLKYDWKQTFVDATLQVPNTVCEVCNIDWDDYVNWDLVKLTQNYLLLHLRLFMQSDCNGVLLHCISGWDRTPLFVSLMRLSLWADGLAHESLDAREMAYFTIAYDWLLFQHQFKQRVDSGEEIFFFCFDFLKYICGNEFSLSKNQLNEESSFTNGSVKHYSNGSTHSAGSQPYLVIPSNNGNALPVTENIVMPSDKVENSYFPPNCDVETRNDDTGAQTAILCVQPTVEHQAGDNDVSSTPSYRSTKLMELRDLVLNTYKECRKREWQEQTEKPGMAASFLNQITRTFSLVKK